jgi:septum formation topological specificity factor MinE
MSQMINNEFESITYNQKFYSDYLHRNIIKILLSNNNQLTTNLLNNLMKSSNMEKFKNIVSTNMLLIDISNKLNWSNLPKKLNYLNFFYKNDAIVYYQDKINKNIMPDNFDGRIKKVIENPFEMFKFLRKEKDFVKWTKFISEKVIQLYYVPISLSSEDFGSIGKLIYLLYNINDQNTKDPSYINFINFCNLNSKLILDSNRINLKIKEYFPNLKTNINLGFLAKHLTWDKESITFEEQNNQDKTPDVLALEMKLHIATKKYYKYKAKYLETKDEDINTAIINFKEDQKKLASDTSSVLPK